MKLSKDWHRITEELTREGKYGLGVCNKCGTTKTIYNGKSGRPNCLNVYRYRMRIKGNRRRNGSEVVIPFIADEHCEICGSTNRISFDHDHKRHKFRGWLCTRCNAALAMVDDDMDILQKLILYLEKHKC